MEEKKYLDWERNIGTEDILYLHKKMTTEHDSHDRQTESREPPLILLFVWILDLSIKSLFQILCKYREEFTVASWLFKVLVSRSSSPGLNPGQDFVLCSSARHFTLTVPLSTQVHKWVLTNLVLGVTQWSTSIPSRERRNTPSGFILQKLEEVPAWWATCRGWYADFTVVHGNQYIH